MSFEKLEPVQLLRLIRDRRANTWEGLCKESGVDPDRCESVESFLLNELDLLRKAGLIEFEIEEREPFTRPNFKGDIRISASWELIQNTLGISLAKLAETNPNDLLVRPYLGSPHDDPPLDSEKNDLFVLMPFSKSLRPVYDDHIKKVSLKLKLSVARADDFFSAHSIMKDVWRGIFYSRAIIADCTGRNPNVFYEIGLAHVLGRPVILITQNEKDVPFDLRNMRHIKYTFTLPGMMDFEDNLTRTIGYVLERESDTTLHYRH